jgi:hypothetical protein
MKFKKWLNEQSYAGIEDADSSQIERIYKKSRLAVKIVQDYDKQTGNNYLTNITTIAPISRAGIFGLYNSAENKAIIGKPYNQQKFTFSQDEIEKMKSLPQDILRQHGVPDEISLIEVIHSIKSIKGISDIHHVHIRCLNEHSYAMEAHIVSDRTVPSEEIKKLIKEKLHHFHIEHSTLEFEDVKCDEAHC